VLAEVLDNAIDLIVSHVRPLYLLDLDCRPVGVS